MKRIFSAFACVSTAAHLYAAASDLPFGAGGLPQLSADSTIVVRSTGAERLLETDKARVFTVTIREVIHGAPVPEQVAVLVPTLFGDLQESSFADALTFLAGPLNDEQHRYWGVEIRPLYQVANGTRGVIQYSDARASAIRSFIGHEQPASKVSWAAEQLGSSDHFLERSAILELRRHPDDPESLRLLFRAINSNEVHFLNRELAVRVLQDSERRLAFELLRQTAEGLWNPMPLRLQAVDGVRKYPAGSELLLKWQRSKDQVLATAARMSATDQ